MTSVQVVRGPSPQQVLATPMRDNDAQAETIGQYLLALLLTYWREGGSFSPKRPFGESDWRTAVWAALGDAGHITYVEDDDGCVAEADDVAANVLIEAAIAELVRRAS